jgi:thiamine biosynthesis protein ThiI
MEHAGASIVETENTSDDFPVLFLIKVGEIALKGENRGFFESRLRRNIRRQLEDVDCSVRGGNGRFYLRVRPQDEQQARRRLATVFGITSFSRTLRVAKDMTTIRRNAEALVATYGKDLLSKSFKVEARRTDKQFPVRSYDIAADLGSTLLERYPSLNVDVHKPNWVLNIEIREQAYLYVDRNEGPGGLPVGTSGRALLLLSGGIDSPVAGYLMAKRGLKISAVYFHAYPYTSDKAREKVETLARIISPYLSGLNLYVVPFTETQMRIKERAAPEEVTLLMRACMMRIAECLAARENSGCLVTGESLGQVASQTMESMRFTGNVTDLPVFRPLIGMDKEEIIALARRVGTFETSILPYEDCCTIFSPRHPLIRPNPEKMKRSFEKLEIEEMLTRACDKAEAVTLAP